MVPRLEDLRKHALFKQRSYDTSINDHLPLLGSRRSKSLVVLLGDSIIERMATTCESQSFQPWPSEMWVGNAALESFRDQASCSIRRLSGVFQAGVGGDKLQHIMYRLVGDGDASRPMPGLLEALEHYDVPLWVIHAGSNNIHRRRGLADGDIECLHLLLSAVASRGRRVLLTGLFYRKDVPRDVIDAANDEYLKLIRRLNSDAGEHTFDFLGPPAEFDPSVHLEDHVHLTKAGYQRWAARLL
ncbi:SGNH hydrolase-type esterase domain-containing protein, partial [Plectosphaerella cucumerina]